MKQDSISPSLLTLYIWRHNLKRIINTMVAKGAYYNGTALSELRLGGTTVFVGGGIHHSWGMSGSSYSSTNITYTLPGSGAKQNADGYFIISGGWTHTANANSGYSNIGDNSTTVTFKFYAGSNLLWSTSSTATAASNTGGSPSETVTGSFGNTYILGNGQLLTSVVMTVTSQKSNCRTDASANITLF